MVKRPIPVPVPEPEPDPDFIRLWEKTKWYVFKAGSAFFQLCLEVLCLLTFFTNQFSTSKYFLKTSYVDLLETVSL